MQSIKWLGLTLGAIVLPLCGCGGGPSTVYVQPPAALKYTTETADYTKGTAIAANSPASTGGAVSVYGVNPALPAGLTLSPSTGVISGTPSAVTATASYAITTANSAGSATATLSITVSDQPPSKLSYTSGTAVYAIRAPITPNSPSSTGGAVTSPYRRPPPRPVEDRPATNPHILTFPHTLPRP